MFLEQPQAFVALPDEPGNEALRSAIEETLNSAGVRAAWPGESTRAAGSMQEGIRETDFVIADVTGSNPNVMIEVGMAMGMGKRVLLLARERSARLPVDLAATQVAVYQPGNVDSVKRYLELWLRDVMAERIRS
jgi:nucleoside 2-deoxyribosyltransferase